MQQGIFTKGMRLENARVLLRELTEQDVQHLVTFSLNEPENWTYGLENAAGEENLRAYIANALDGKRSGQSYPFIIFDKHTQTFAGSTRYYQINPKHKRLAIGYTWLGNKYKRTGLNIHIKYLMLEYAFEILHMERVEFMADVMNENSILSILALGATKEGIMRSHAEKPDGHRRDTAVFSILKKEWLEHVKPSLLQKISI